MPLCQHVCCKCLHNLLYAQTLTHSLTFSTADSLKIPRKKKNIVRAKHL